jgi:ATP-dependent Clp protease protease subunit
MIHQPLGGVHGQAEDILIEAREIDKCRSELYDIISRHSGQSYDKVFNDADRNYWMTADQAREYGMIDRILVK